MGMFTTRKPRGFHHNYIYYDPRKEKLKMVILSKLNSHMLPEGVGARPYVHGDVENPSFDDPHEFGLTVLAFLEMQTAQHPIGGAAFIVLYECDLAYLGVEFPLAVRLEEISP